MPPIEIPFEYKIETKEVRFGRWIYVIHLNEDRSRPSRKFRTQEAALDDAYEMLSYML
ncbi:hypothetical protein GGD50_001209 [Rhizobium paranaense]|uniref:Integrase n=1 Tax=Rhizobium paranaense TaxID=1650438 RepID=A0A7W8XNF7_9HYPH|nr:hypothetical protein [Rhizobium paranaense]